MAHHLLIAFPLVVILAACGAAQPTAQAPVEVTRVVTQVVPRVVTQVVTQIVVVTATRQPTEPVVAPTRAPEPTAAPEPTIEPTAAAPEPTSAPEPLAQGETVPGKIVRTISVFDIPNEAEGKQVISAKPGDIVEVLYRGGQWYQIKGVSTDSEEVKGWVYRDWISIAPEDAARVQTYPDALPVLVGKLTQTISNGKDYWTGTIFNIGSLTAKDVEMEISITGYAGGSQTKAAYGKAFVVGKDIAAGQTAKFKVVTDFVSGKDGFFEYKVLWSVK